MMNFGEAINVCLKQKFATFTGRAARSEYWWFFLFMVLAGIVASVIDAILGTNIVLGMDKRGNPQVLGIINAIVSLALLLPSLAVTARRLHDRNLSGWLIAVPFVLFVLGGVLTGIPVIAMILILAGFGVGIYIFVMTILKGTDGTNNYGPDPLIDPNQSGNIFVP